MGRILFFLIQKRFLKTLTPPPALLSPASPVLTTADSSPATSSSIVEYLTSSCGLSSKSALSVSQKLKFRESNLRNPQLVLHFLKAHNFSDTHIAKIIQKAPRVLLSSVEDTLRPKFDFLIGIGFAGRLLPDLIASDPFVLCRSLDSHLKACFQLLRPFLESNNKFGLSIRRCSWLLSGGFRGTVQANLEFLTKQGVPANCIGKLLLSHPRTISQKHERVVYTLQAVKGLGYDPESPMFVHAFGVMMRMRESTWKKKIELLKSFGWSEEEILTAFRRYPFFMECSEEKVRIAIDFYLNTIKLERQDIISSPALLMFSMDKRVCLRWNILQVLKSNNLVEKDVKIKWVLLMPEKLFLQKYVTCYAHKIPELLKLYGSTNKAIR